MALFSKKNLNRNNPQEKAEELVEEITSRINFNVEGEIIKETDEVYSVKFKRLSESLTLYLFTTDMEFGFYHCNAQGYVNFDFINHITSYSNNSVYKLDIFDIYGAAEYIHDTLLRLFPKIGVIYAPYITVTHAVPIGNYSVTTRDYSVTTGN